MLASRAEQDKDRHMGKASFSADLALPPYKGTGKREAPVKKDKVLLPVIRRGAADAIEPMGRRDV